MVRREFRGQLTAVFERSSGMVMVPGLRIATLVAAIR